MDSANQNQSGTPVPKQQIDFGAAKVAKGVNAANATNSADSAKVTPPAPVTSAKAAINAMYAKQAGQPQAPMVMSAREAVNAAARQDGVQHTKSASNLHHGSIQRSMESTRTSASALLRRASDEVKVETRASSLDPLAKARPASTQRRPEREIPVVRTSLKLGAAARPKPAPVVLPPNARMAQVARPVENLADRPQPRSMSSKIAKFLRRGAVDAQIVQPQGLARGAGPKALVSGQPSAPAQDDNALTVKIVSPTSQTARSASVASAASSVSSAAHVASATRPVTPKRKVSGIRDPQMLAGARRSARSRAQSLASQAETAEVLGAVTPASASRFRAKPKDFSADQPAALPTDNSYIMSEPPKLSTKKPSAPEIELPDDDLGVVESYHSANAITEAAQNARGYEYLESSPDHEPSQSRAASQSPEYRPRPVGDRAPTGSIKAQTVASGHVQAPRVSPAQGGRTAQSGLSAAPTAKIPTIKADNTSNYSFSQKKSEPDNNRYSLGGESPFLRSVNVEKRPLSNSPDKFNPKVERRATVDPTEIAKKSSLKTSRKNHYPKAKAISTPRQEMPVRPTVIVPSNRRSKAPLFFLVLITIILGAAVGAAVYLCFFQ